MSEVMYVRGLKLCQKCKFSAKQNSQEICCSYITITGHSRTLLNGKRRLPSGYCDKFEEREEYHESL